MKAALLLLLAALPADAACRYFRTTSHPSACRVAETQVEPQTSTDTLPGLEEPLAGPTVEIHCVCAYTLQGSDPLCALEREEEFIQTLPEDADSPLCRRTKTLCATLCPRRLP
jgi:hypothetical protein